MNIAITVLVLLGVFAALLIPGCPISISITISSIATTLTNLPWDQTSFIVTQEMNSGVESFSLLVVSLSILAGNIMNNGGIARRLTNFAQLLSGRIPGSLAHTNVLANMFSGALPGSAVAVASTIGGTMDPMEKENGHDSAFSICVNIVLVPIRFLIPPTSAFIVYSTVMGGASISVLFMAGYAPEILMGATTVLTVYFYTKKHKYLACEKVNAFQAMKVTLDALPSLSLIVIVAGGIVGGIFTVTEGAGTCVLHCLILSLVYRSINWKSFMNTLLKSMATSGIILFLIFASSAMPWMMAYTGISEAISNAMMSISSNKCVILLMMNLVLLVAGMFFGITSACLVFIPIFLPIVQSLDMDLVQFGVVLIFNMYMGTMTPPVGSVLFVPCGISKVSIEEVVKPLLPYVGVLLLVLLLATYIPEISLTFPRLMGLV